MRKLNARTLAVAILIAAAMALVAASAVILRQSYLQTMVRIQTQARASAHVVSGQMKWIVGSSRQALREINGILGPDPATPSDAAKSAIRNIIEGMPAQVGARVFDMSGRVVLSTQDINLDASAADRAFFQELQSGKAEQHVSSLITGRSTNVQQFVVAQRLERNGAFAGVAAITVPATLMAEFFRSLGLYTGSTVSVFRTDGWLVARYPLPDGPMNLANYILFTEHLPRSSTGTYDAVSPADGVTRVVAYRKIEDEDLLALASLGTASELQAFWTQLRWSSATLVTLLTGLAIVIVWLFRVLRREDIGRAALEKALKQNQLLFQEVHHRVKNNLQAVSSLIHLAPIERQAKDDMTLRLAAMAAIHEQAYRSNEYGDVLLSEYLSRLIDNMVKSYGERAKIESRLEHVVVDRDQALPLGLVTNEILSNAFKHAFPDRTTGVIRVELTAHGHNHAKLMISDNGVGFDPAQESKGIGGRLIRGLIAQLGGEMRTTTNSGTSFTLRFALSQRTET